MEHHLIVDSKHTLSNLVEKKEREREIAHNNCNACTIVNIGLTSHI